MFSTKIVLFCLLLFFISCKKQEVSSDETMPNPSMLDLGSVSTKGIFDPSLTYDSSTSKLWMSYSAADTSLNLNPSQTVVSTRLAFSTDAGSTWTDSTLVANSSLDVALSFSGLPASGTWHNEVSRVIYDPYSTNASNRWKLFSHHYLIINTTNPAIERRFEHGWIGYKSASTAENLAAATEIKLFGASGYDNANNTQAGQTGSPIGGAPVINLHSLHSDLNNCAVFSEPGFLSTSSYIYMSIACFEIPNVRIALLRCTQPCPVTSGWSYVATLLQNTQASALGYINFSATELFDYNGSNYLMVTPEGTLGSPGIYHGCLVYKFTDINAGALLGSPTYIKEISGTANSFNGACGYTKESLTGILYSEVNSSDLYSFQIFKSNLQPD